MAAGAGVSLAFAADVVSRPGEARFVPAFNRIGLVPDSGLARTLVRGVGRHRAFEILMGERQLAVMLDGRTVAAVVPADRLADAARELAQRLAEGPTVSIGLTKRLLNAPRTRRSPSRWRRRRRCRSSPGAATITPRASAFGEKRDPRFSGR